MSSLDEYYDQQDLKQERIQKRLGRVALAAVNLAAGKAVIIPRECLLPKVGTNLLRLKESLEMHLNADHRARFEKGDQVQEQWAVSIFPYKGRRDFFRARAELRQRVIV